MYFITQGMMNHGRITKYSVSASGYPRLKLLGSSTAIQTKSAYLSSTLSSKGENLFGVAQQMEYKDWGMIRKVY